MGQSINLLGSIRAISFVKLLGEDMNSQIIGNGGDDDEQSIPQKLRREEESCKIIEDEGDDGELGNNDDGR